MIDFKKMERIIIGGVTLSFIPYLRSLLKHKLTNTLKLKLVSIGIVLWHLFLKTRKQKEEIKVEKYAIGSLVGVLFKK